MERTPLPQSFALFAAVASFLALPCGAQEPVQPSQPPPIIAQHYEPAGEIASPMMLEVSLGATAKRKSVQDMDPQHAWIATETAAYSCKSARVRFIQVWKTERNGKIHLRVVPVMNDHPDVDIAVSVAIVSDSKEIRGGVLTGHGNGVPNAAVVLSPLAALDRSASPEADFDFAKEEFAALFGPGRAPSVRVIVTVEE